ncbi:NepR family anti-sigma factor [Methylocystis sp. SB2]|uniref:NepR family anti-sigma factor n=2 Tax=Methylocystaceae TaxID=31993 RepID=UPI0006EB92B1
MPPHENRARLTETTMRGNRYIRDAVDVEPCVKRLGEQLRSQFSDIASEPLPVDMLALLEELSQVSAVE